MHTLVQHARHADLNLILTCLYTHMAHTTNRAFGSAGSKAGKAFIVYGSAAYGTASAPTPDMSVLAAPLGVTIDGIMAGGLTGTSVAAAGDLQVLHRILATHAHLSLCSCR